MSRPTLSIVIPTQGRNTLARCLASIVVQAEAGDEILVVADTREELQQDVGGLVAAFGLSSPARWRYLEHDGGRMSWGHDQMERGLSAATAEWIVALDDDDIHLPGAYDAIRAAAVDHYGPMLFRFYAHYGVTIWTQVGDYTVGRIGGHCLVQPNVKDKLAPFPPAYTGDRDWIIGTVANWGGNDSVKWVDHVIAQCRPRVRRQA